MCIFRRVLESCTPLNVLIGDLGIVARAAVKRQKGKFPDIDEPKCKKKNAYDRLEAADDRTSLRQNGRAREFSEVCMSEGDCSLSAAVEDLSMMLLVIDNLKTDSYTIELIGVLRKLGITPGSTVVPIRRR